MPTITIAATLQIPDIGSLFYIGGDATPQITAFATNFVNYGRTVTFIIATASTKMTGGTAYASATSGQYCTVSGGYTMGVGDVITFRQLDTGVWVQTEYTDIA